MDEPELIRFPVFRDDKGNRFVFPGLYHGGGERRVGRRHLGPVSPHPNRPPRRAGEGDPRRADRCRRVSDLSTPSRRRRVARFRSRLQQKSGSSADQNLRPRRLPKMTVSVHVSMRKLVGVAGFEPATPSSRTMCRAVCQRFVTRFHPVSFTVGPIGGRSISAETVQ
jgi:hypothetical protein